MYLSILYPDACAVAAQTTVLLDGEDVSVWCFSVDGTEWGADCYTPSPVDGGPFVGEDGGLVAERRHGKVRLLPREDVA